MTRSEIEAEIGRLRERIGLPGYRGAWVTAWIASRIDRLSRELSRLKDTDHDQK